MKKVIILLYVCVVPLFLMVQAELKSNGKMAFGNEGPTPLSSEATVSVYNNGVGTYPKLSFGQLTKNSSGEYSGVFAGEWTGDYGPKRLWLHGDNGFYLTKGKPKDNETWGVTTCLMGYDATIPENAIYINSNVYIGVGSGNTNKLRVTGEVWAGGIKLTSDTRLKTDVKEIENPLSRLQLLRGVNYRLLDKPKRDPFGVKIEENEADKKPSEQEQIGFLAQELEKVFPNLVDVDDDGYFAINYIGLIPVIVEAMKEQQQELKEQKELITAQSLKIAELQAAQGEAALMPEGTQARMVAIQPENRLATGNVAVANAFLYQNAPNPFNVRTEIRYYLPQEIVTATLYVFTMQGALVKSFSLTGRGEEVQTIEASEFTPGMYIYSLVADNREVDAKRMIITE